MGGLASCPPVSVFGLLSVETYATQAFPAPNKSMPLLPRPLPPLAPMPCLYCHKTLQNKQTPTATSTSTYYTHSKHATLQHQRHALPTATSNTGTPSHHAQHHQRHRGTSRRHATHHQRNTGTLNPGMPTATTAYA